MTRTWCGVTPYQDHYFFIPPYSLILILIRLVTSQRALKQVGGPPGRRGSVTWSCGDGTGLTSSVTGP